MQMKITSRNVNGIRAVMKKWFLEWLQQDNSDILCLQETKAFEHQIPAEMKYLLNDYNYIWHTGERPGYAGTAIFFKKNIEILETKNNFDNYPEFHKEWRVTEIRFEYFPTLTLPPRGKEQQIPPYEGGHPNEVREGGKKIALLNIYFPNWWTRADGTEMLSYKLDFYDQVIEYCKWLKKEWFEVIITGDFNICHTAIDIARPKENENSIWFLPIEREKMSEMQSSWFTDVFRKLNPKITEHYTWWSYRAGARPRNVGWRLDYFWVSKWIEENIKTMFHQDQVLGSDHCPVSLEIE